MQTYFVRADSSNLPKVDAFMVALFFNNNNDYNAAELKNVKTAVMIALEHYNIKNVDQFIGNIESHNEDDNDMCEATYLILDSISTQYIGTDGHNDENKTDGQEFKHDDHCKNNDVTDNLRSMELKHSAANGEIADSQNIKAKLKGISNCTVKNNLTVSKEDNKRKTKNNLQSQIIPPAFTRWYKTFNKVKDSLGLEIFSRTDPISKHLKEKHAHATYAELLCKMTETKNLKEVNGIMQMKLRNELINVPMVNFHSYIHSDNGTECIVCYTTFPNEEADIHKYEVKHMNHVVKCVDYRGMRRIDSKYSHCIVCNLKVRNKKEASKHTKTRQHIQTRQLLMIPILKF